MKLKSLTLAACVALATAGTASAGGKSTGNAPSSPYASATVAAALAAEAARIDETLGGMVSASDRFIVTRSASGNFQITSVDGSVTFFVGGSSYVASLIMKYG